MNRNNENEEKCPIIKTPQNTVKEQVSLSTSLQQITNVRYINLYNLLDLPTMVHYFIFQRRFK